MVVEDPRNGQVLALATYPDYNPSDFLGAASAGPVGVLQQPGQQLPHSSTGPISTGYAPGSTWKLITATAMLRYGLRTPGTYYDDLGTYTIGGQIFNDNDNTALGDVDLAQAITESSDTYFYSVGGPVLRRSTTTGTAAARARPPAKRRLPVRPGPLQRHRPPRRGTRARPRRPGRRQRCTPSTPRTTRTATGSPASRSRRRSARARTWSPRSSSTTPTPPSPTAAPCTCPRWPWPWRRPGTGDTAQREDPQAASTRR